MLDFVASLLGIPTEFLANALTIRQIETKHGARAGTTYALNLNKMQVRVLFHVTHNSQS